MEKARLFGASLMGEIAYRHLKDRYDIVGFIDNDPSKQGATFQGLPVDGLASGVCRVQDSLIIICSQYVYEIIAQLLEFGLRRFAVFAIDPACAISEDSGNVIECNFPEDVSVDRNMLAISVHNASGSNTYALSSYADLSGPFTVKTVFEHKKCSELFETRIMSGNFVCTHDNVIAKDRRCFQLWHGFPLKGLNYMSRYQTRRHREEHQKYWSRYCGIASYSATYTTLMNACFGGSIEQYALTGMPRNDFLFHSDGRSVFEKVTGRSNRNGILAAYLPTFRTTHFGQVNGAETGALFDFNGFDLDKLETFLTANNITLTIKMHPYERQGAEAARRMAASEAFCLVTDEMLVKAHVDFYEMLNAFDVLIADYSSVYFDYLLLDRPIVFTPTDLQDYDQTRGFLLEPYDFWAPGPKCLTQASLQKAIGQAIENPSAYAPERERVTDIVHHYRDGNSSQRVADMIMERLASTS